MIPFYAYCIAASAGVAIAVYHNREPIKEAIEDGIEALRDGVRHFEERRRCRKKALQVEKEAKLANDYEFNKAVEEFSDPKTDSLEGPLYFHSDSSHRLPLDSSREFFWLKSEADTTSNSDWDRFDLNEKPSWIEVDDLESNGSLLGVTESTAGYMREEVTHADIRRRALN